MQRAGFNATLRDGIEEVPDVNDTLDVLVVVVWEVVEDVADFIIGKMGDATAFFKAVGQIKGVDHSAGKSCFVLFVAGISTATKSITVIGTDGNPILHMTFRGDTTPLAKTWAGIVVVLATLKFR